MTTPALRVTVLVLSDTSELANVDSTNTVLDTSFNDVLGEGVEEVGSALRPLVVQPSSPFATRVVALGDFFREVVAVLFQTVSGVQVGFPGAVRDSREVTDTKVDTCCLVTGSVGSLNFVFADEVQFPPTFRLVVDGTNLL